jgi:hypothetical protein
MTAVEIGAKISLLDVFHARTRSQLAALIADRSRPCPATVVQRTHEYGADGRLAGALRELIG